MIIVEMMSIDQKIGQILHENLNMSKVCALIVSKMLTLELLEL